MDENQLVIFELQQYLRNISFMNPNITRIIPDGIYGEETVRAVNDFQRQQNIKQTGEVDFDTWQQLVSENEKAEFMLSVPIQTAPVRNENLPLEKGDTGILVAQLKLMLNFIAQEFVNFEKLVFNQIFDELTEKQVKKWQKIINHEQTGKVDKKTWNTLSRFYTLYEEKE